MLKEHKALRFLNYRNISIKGWANFHLKLTTEEQQMKKTLGLILILSGWLFSPSSMATEAGWINNLDGNPEDYLIKRAEVTEAVSVFMVLHVGDEIISLKEGNQTITLSLRAGTETVKVTTENSPYQIQPESQVPEALAEVWDWTKQRLEEWIALTAPVRAEDSSDSETPHDIVMPLLENMNHPAHLLAGERPLHLKWYGGEANYTVHIKKRRNILLTQHASETDIETEKMQFQVRANRDYQSYRVIVRDAQEQMFTGGFRVVKTLPKVTKPEGLDILNLPENFIKTVEATWLATKQHEGKWNFEAYQQAAQLSSYRPAMLLKEALARGQEQQVRRGIRG
jgi:hypothetical protein